jgi:diacylglycerol kinase family enzyme
MRTLAYMRPFSAEIVLGGNARKVRTIQIAVGNGRHYGGGLTIAEAAEIDDGFLDVYSIETDRLWKLALIYPAFRQGRLAFGNEIRTAACTEVEIRTRRPRPINTDGEITTRTPARFRVLPRAIRVFAPEKVS